MNQKDCGKTRAPTVLFPKPHVGHTATARGRWTIRRIRGSRERGYEALSMCVSPRSAPDRMRDLVHDTASMTRHETQSRRRQHLFGGGPLTHLLSAFLQSRMTSSSSLWNVFLALALFWVSSTASSFSPSATPSMTTTSAASQVRQEFPLFPPVSRGGGSNKPKRSRSVEVGASKELGPNAPPPGPLRKALPDFPWHRVPNMLTYIRCLAIPGLVVLFHMPGKHVACGTLFGIASLTDWLDGFLARRWDITSAFGAFLDPVADKLMVSTSLILLSGRYGSQISIPTSIILAREIAVSALREWMAQRGERDIVKVGMQGKIKTAVTMVSLTLLLFVPIDVHVGFLSRLYEPALMLLYLCALVTVTSGSVYFRAAAPILLDS